MEEPYWTKDYISGIRLFVESIIEGTKVIETELSTIKKFNERCYKPMISQLKQIEALNEIYGSILGRNIDNQLNDLVNRCERMLYENKKFHDDFMNEISPLYDKYYNSLNKLRNVSTSAGNQMMTDTKDDDVVVDIPSWITYPYMLDSQISINSCNEMIEYILYLRDNITMIQQYKLFGNKRYFHGIELINTIRIKYPLIDTSQYNINRIGQDLIEMGLIEEYSSRRLYMSRTQLTYDIERDYCWVERKEISSNDNDFLSEYSIVEENKVNLEIIYCKNCLYYDTKMKPGMITNIKHVKGEFYKILREQLFKDITIKTDSNIVVSNKIVYGCGYYLRDNCIPITHNNKQFLFGQIKYDNTRDICESIDLIMKQCCNNTINQIDIWHGDINLQKASKLKIQILTNFYNTNVSNADAIKKIVDDTHNTTLYHCRDWSDLLKLWLNELPGGIILYDKLLNKLVVSQSYKGIFSVIVTNLFLQDKSIERIARILDIDSGGQIMVQSLIRDYNRNRNTMKQIAIKICELIMNWDCDQHDEIPLVTDAQESDPSDFIPLPYKTTPRI